MNDEYFSLPVPDFKNNPMWVCSMCLKLARVYAKQPNDCPGCGRNDCADPYRGGSFPFYEGPLTEDLFKRFCFICGEPSVMLVSATGSLFPRIVGVCPNHTPDRFKDIEIENETGPEQGPGKS